MSQRAGRRPWGTYALYVVTALGLIYLFIPLFTIARFTFNRPPAGSRYNTEWNEFTLDNWKHAFDASDYRDAFVESVKVALVACTLATILGALVALAIAIGIIGIVVPLLPGTLLVYAAIAVWAFVVNTTVSWVVFAIAAALYVASQIIKYTWPVQRMRAAIAGPVRASRADEQLAGE